MTDKWFLSANDDTAAASTHPVRSKEEVCVTPLNRYKRPVSYTVQVSISGGEEEEGVGGEKSAAIEPRRGQIQSAEQSPKAPHL